MQHPILIFISVFLINSALAQTDTIYYNSQHEKAQNLENALYYSIYTHDIRGFVKTEEYYLDGIKMSSGQVISLKFKQRIGLHEYYYKNGQIAEQGYFSGGKKVGVWKKQFENGQLKEKAEYLYKEGLLQYIPIDIWNQDGVQTLKDGTGTFIEYYDDIKAKGYGKLVNSKKTGTWIGVYNSGEKYYEETYSTDSVFSGFSFDKNGNRYSYSNPIELPKFDEKHGSFQDYFSKKLHLSNLINKSHPSGSRLEFIFTIESDGSVTNVKPAYNVEKHIDQQIVNTFKNSPKWSPSLYRGMPKKINLLIPVLIP